MREEAKSLINIVLLFLFLLAMVLLFMVNIKPAFGISPIIPRERHFICEIGFWNKLFGRQPEHFIVKARISNGKRPPVEVQARCEVITIDATGRLHGTKKMLRVEPANCWLYPDNLKTFKIYFPVKSTSSTLALFTATPVVEAKEGKIIISVAQGFVLAATFGKYKPKRPTFMVSKDNGKITATIKNDNPILIEGTFKLRGEDEDTARHFFLQAGNTRIFEIADPEDDFNAAILDIGGLPRMFGIRLK